MEAIVTGAGQGIGRQIAYRLAREGPAVIIGDINEEGGMVTAQEIRRNGGKAWFLRTEW